jgi:endoglucanase
MRLSLILKGLVVLVGFVVVVVVAIGGYAVLQCRPVALRSGLPPLSVTGNRLLAGDRPLQVRGVNRSGTEYACVQNWGIFDGPSDAASVGAMAAWHVDFVRIPINEDCWLGINQGQNSGAFYGDAYRQAIEGYVQLLHEQGMYAELSLMWAAPAAYPATYQSNGPDQDHSPALWASLAATFKNDPGVVLSPWGETTVGWQCFRNGCSDQATFGPQNGLYETAGMQEAVDVMRKAGFKGPIAISCIAYANECGNYNNGSWLEYEPSDPERALLAEIHVYGRNACDTPACFDTTYAPVAARVPMIWAETGSSYDAADCDASWITMAMHWADQHGVGYEAWAWDTWRSCLALISDYQGTPSNAYGQWVHQHYAELAAEPTPTPLARPRPQPPASAC